MDVACMGAGLSIVFFAGFRVVSLELTTYVCVDRVNLFTMILTLVMLAPDARSVYSSVSRRTSSSDVIFTAWSVKRAVLGKSNRRNPVSNSAIINHRPRGVPTETKAAEEPALRIPSA
jgi:hypothetical protein